MDDARLRESVITHLQQMHAVERAQVGELRTLADEMAVAAVAQALAAHADATVRHGDLLEQRLAELDAGSSLRLLAQTFGGAAAKVVVDRIRPHDTLAILRDAAAAEAGEVASYVLLEAEAVRAGDDSTATLASEVRAEEAATRDLLMGFWHQALDHHLAELQEASPGASENQLLQAMLIDHLRDLHALERNAVVMLTTVLATVKDETARARVGDHRQATSRHGDTVAERLHELGSRPSLRKQAQGYAFAALKGPINLVRAERAAKDMRDMYVVEHFELIAYAQLAAMAERSGDEKTLRLATAHAAEEAAMADWLEREGARFLLESMHARTTR